MKRHQMSEAIKNMGLDYFRLYSEKRANNGRRFKWYGLHDPNDYYRASSKKTKKELTKLAKTFFGDDCEITFLESRWHGFFSMAVRVQG